MDEVFTDALKRFLEQIGRSLRVHGPVGGDDATGSPVDSPDSHSGYLRAAWHYLHEEASRRRAPMYIYPAGAHTRWLLAVTEDLPRAQLKGLLDDAPKGPAYDDLPVQTPQQAVVEDGAFLLISSDAHESEIVSRARGHFGDRVTIIRLYAGLPPGPYPRPEPPESIERRREAARRARVRWGGSDFIGPYEQAGNVPGFLQEQWLWARRHLLRGHVLDMSTPRHWHGWVHEVPTVSHVSISDRDQSIVMKGGYTSKVDYCVDFCADPLSVAPHTFDTVLCFSILEHCADPGALVRNLHGVLTPGGVLLIVVPFAAVDGHCRPDYWRFGRDGLTLLAQQAGFPTCETGSSGDVGPMLEDTLGYSLAANEQHSGIPLVNWLTARKS